MSLADDLRAKTLALISQQMANWVVEIQKHIAEHQNNLVRNLDELQETVARYDEQIDENAIASTMASVLANQSAATTGPGYDRLKASIAEVEKGANLSEVLTCLVNESSRYFERVAMFIVKGTNAIGWYGRGFQQPDLVKQVNIPLGSDTVFRSVHNSRQTLRGHVSHSPGTAQALARLGGSPQGTLAVPLMLRDKLAAILYCDTSLEQVPAAEGDLVEILVVFSGKTIDLLSALPKPAVGRTTAGGGPLDRPVVTPEAPPVRPPAPPPPRQPAPQPQPAGDDGGSSTVIFKAGAIQEAMKGQGQATPQVQRTAPSASLSPDEQKAHEDAKRFARLVVSEIKLYNENKVNEGRRQRDLYERLKDDIERGRQMYAERVNSHVRETTNYFYDELVRILAGGDPNALGPM